MGCEKEAEEQDVIQSKEHMIALEKARVRDRHHIDSITVTTFICNTVYLREIFGGGLPLWHSYSSPTTLFKLVAPLEHCGNKELGLLIFVTLILSPQHIDFQALYSLINICRTVQRCTELYKNNWGEVGNVFEQKVICPFPPIPIAFQIV